MRISDWSSDVCSSDLVSWARSSASAALPRRRMRNRFRAPCCSVKVADNFAAKSAIAPGSVHALADGYRQCPDGLYICCELFASTRAGGSEEHTSELQSLMRISYAVFCLKKKKQKSTVHSHPQPSATSGDILR